MFKNLVFAFCLIWLLHLCPVDAANKKYCKCRSKALTRIVGGSVAKPNAYPWQISLGLLPDTPWGVKPDKFAVGKRENLPSALKISTHICGGVILTRNLVLTAAHCVTNDDLHPKPISSIGVGLGNKHNLIDIYNHGRIPVQAIYPHPNYNVSMKDTTDDIAIIKLAESIDFDSESISPACFLQENEGGKMKDYDQVISTGWGSVNVMSFNYISQVWEGYKASLQLKEVTFKDMSQSSSTCKQNNKLICIGPLNALKTKESVCKGDSGGPLHYLLEGHTFVVGITSFGSARRLGPFQIQACAGEAGYTRVQSVLEWIKTIAGDDMCLFEQVDLEKARHTI